MKIILAEDDHVTRILIETMVKKLGFDIYSCVDGKDAYNIIMGNSQYYDIVLTDIMMPNMSGIELSYRIKKLSGLYIPIIAITAYDKGLFKPELVRHFDDWIIKPIKADNFYRVINKYKDRGSHDTLKFIKS